MKALYCRDAGYDCKMVIRARSNEEVMNQATRHTREVHGMEATPTLQEDLKRLIREE